MTIQTPVPGADTQAFRDAMASMAATVCVVAAGRGEARAGRTVTAAISLGIDPPTVLVSIAQGSRLALAIHEAGSFSFSMLAEDQSELAQVFAGRRAVGDRFGPEWSAWPTGTPRLAGGVATMDCRLSDAFGTSGHTLFVGEVTDIDQTADALPLLWHDRDFFARGERV